MARARDPFRSLEAWLKQSTTPLFLVERGGTLRWFNAGCETLTGWTADEVRGEICSYTTAGDATTLAALAGALCPPPDLWSPSPEATDETREVAAFVPTRAGDTAPRRIRFLPLNGDAGAADGQPTAILGVILPWREPAGGALVADDWHAELAALRSQLRQRHAPAMLVSRSHATRRLRGQIEIASPLQCHLLLTGEPGAGKEHVARTIHLAGPAKSQWFVPLECGRTPAEELRRVLTRLLERHEAPSMAARSPMPGTVYLDEVDRLPRDLQEQIVVSSMLPVAERPRLRFMGATSLAPDSLVDDERLRSDFCDLLSPLVLAIPPLRERHDDIIPLAQHFLEDLNRGREQQVSGFRPEVIEQFAEYRWPGNLDELSRVIREAREKCVQEGVAWIDANHLPFRFRTGLGAQRTPAPREPFGPIRLDEVLADCEKELLQRALRETRHNLSRAAELLGINRPRLYRRLEQLGLPTGDASAKSTTSGATERERNAESAADPTTAQSGEG
jgi:DNA-binding NtrC family response regulator